MCKNDQKMKLMATEDNVYGSCKKKNSTQTNINTLYDTNNKL